MKPIRLLLFATVLCAAGSGSALAAGGVGGAFLPKDLKAPTADVVSDAELDAKRGRSPKLEPVPEKKAPPGYDLVELSTFILNGESYTLVPKGSILHIPETRAANVADLPGKQFVIWAGFLASQRAWVSTFEVTLEQARGEVAIPVDKIEAFKKGNSIVVATFRGGAISVAPVKSKDVATGQPTSANP